MKKYILITSLLILGSLSIFASCPANLTLANAWIPFVSGSTDVFANQYARIWIQGLNNPLDGPGTDNDGVPVVDEDCSFDFDATIGGNNCSGFGEGTYYLFTDWWFLEYDGCPLQTGNERAVLLYYDTSLGNYTLMSMLQSEGYPAWDDLGTDVGQPFGQRGEVTFAVLPVDSTTINATFNFSYFFLYGIHEASQPLSPIPTQFRVYFLETVGPGSTPASWDTAVWTAGGTYNVTGASVVVNGMTIPARSDVNNRLWMSISPIYEGTTFPWVSNQPVMLWASNLDPSGAPVIQSVSAKTSGLNTVVTWKSADESKVTGYQVYWAPNASSQFSPVGSVVAPTGNNSTYTTSIRIPSQGSFVVKVGANLLDGTVEYSSVSTVTPSVIIKDRSRVVPN